MEKKKRFDNLQTQDDFRRGAGWPVGAVVFFEDGNALCCVRPDFESLQRDPAGFCELTGDAQDYINAFEALREDEKFGETKDGITVFTR